MLPRAVSSAKSRCPLWRVAVDPLRSLSPQTSPSFPSHLTVPRNHPTTQLRATVTNPDVCHALTNRLPCARHTRASIEASLNGMVLTPCCCRCSPDASIVPRKADMHVISLPLPRNCRSGRRVVQCTALPASTSPALCCGHRMALKQQCICRCSSVCQRLPSIARRLFLP